MHRLWRMRAGVPGVRHFCLGRSAGKMERIRGQERQVFWPVKAETEFLNAQPPKLRVFICERLEPQRTRRSMKVFLFMVTTFVFLCVLCGKWLKVDSTCLGNLKP